MVLPYNPWQAKPWWCRPWSIVLTGVTLILGTWMTTHLMWVTFLVAIPLSIWMGFFVLLWPRLMRQYQADQNSLYTPEQARTDK